MALHIERPEIHPRAATDPFMIEPLLLTAVRIFTFRAGRRLTNASGFFFEREDRLYLVTTRHVLLDEPSGHHPDAIEIELHVNAENLAESASFLIPLYNGELRLWREGRDSAGDIDVAVVEIDRAAMPPTALYKAFTPRQLLCRFDQAEVGTSLLIVGFPLGFHDTLHHMPVVRQAILASSFGLRFQGEGYFLTDARTHRGTSGAPVVMRINDPGAVHDDLPWMVLGVHAARVDVGTRDLEQDEALGLNCAWYIDIVMVLTEP